MGNGLVMRNGLDVGNGARRGDPGPATGVPETDLSGVWMAAQADEDLRRSFPRPDLDDGGWQELVVPGHWRSEPAFADSDGPLLYRKRFEMEGLEAGQRAWLSMDGIFYQSDVWLDGSYLGDTEGYFFPHTFDITSALAGRSEHVLAMEVVCDRPARRAAKRSLLGVFGYWDCIDPTYNPGGIWAPVGVAVSGPVYMSSLRLTCVQADAKSAVLELSAVLDSLEAVTVTLCSEVRRSGPTDGETAVLAGRLETRQPLAVGANRVRWRLVVDEPELWWPAGLGSQSLYDVSVIVELAGEPVCSRLLRTGLRKVRSENLIWSDQRGAGVPEGGQRGAPAAILVTPLPTTWPGTCASPPRRGSTCSACMRTSLGRNSTTPPTNWASCCGKTCHCTAATPGCAGKRCARSRRPSTCSATTPR